MNEHPPTDPETAARLRFLTLRARRAGYQLAPIPDGNKWALLDAADGVELYTGDSLSDVERYLSE